MNHRRTFSLCLLSAAITASTNTLAQTEDENARVLEEILVTSQKISESLQNVPISVSLATAKDIKDINAFDFKDIQEITPGIRFGGGAGLQSAAIRIRGVGPDFFALGTPQSVAVFVDEVAQSQIGAVFSTMVDIKQIELLRGPQGTLYGQNAPGGVFNITTQDPNFDGFNGYVEGSYSSFGSSDLTTKDVRAALNIPLIDDKLAWRLAGVYSDSDGYVKLVSPTAEDDSTGGKDNKAVRSKMLWNASDRVQVKWTVNYQDLEQNPSGPNIDGLVPGTGGTAISPIPATYNKFEDRRNYGESASVVTGDVKDTSLHLTWDTDMFQVDMIGFYQQFDTESNEIREPYPNSPPENVFNIAIDSELTTLELRLSNSGDRLDYVAGLYYFNNTAEGTTFVVEQGVDVNGANESENEGYAAFANVNFHLADKWDLALGMRYDDSEQTLNSSTTFAGIDAKLDDGKLEFDHVSWSVKLRNYINDDMTAYLAIDHAYKQGGFNPLVVGVQALSDGFGFPIPPLVAEAADSSATYDKETSDAIELGLKGTFLEGKLRLGGNIFYQRFEDHQVQQTNQTPAALAGLFGSFFLAATTNAEKVETYGIEADATYLLGDHWDISLRAAYADPTVDEWTSRFCPNGEEESPDQLYCPKGDGDDLNNLPKFNTNFQVGYSRSLDSGWDFYSRGTWTWQSEPDETRLTNDFSEPKNLLGFSMGAGHSGMGIDIRVWGKNLTDEDLNIDPGTKSNGDPSLPAAWRGGQTPGREFGVTMRYQF
jgi:iron complex outermembrane recepter protein